MKVKGTAIVDLVKIMRKDKSKNWEKYLEPDDIEIVNSTIIATSWYPGDSFWRIGHALATEIGKMDLAKQILFGRLSAQTYLKVYRLLLVKGDPAASVERCVNLWESFYDFEGSPYKGTEIEKINSNSVKITAYDYPDMIIPEMRKPYFYGLAGYYQEIAEQALGKEIKIKIDTREDCHLITLSWE